MFKKIILSVLFLSCVSVFAQNGTTQDEYNYMTKGYKIEQESGLDKKKGYDFDAVPLVNLGNYTFEFTVMKRENTKEVAGIICKAISKTWGNTYYLGIPVNNPELFKLHFADIERWDESMAEAYAKATSVLFGSVTTALYAQKD